MYGYGYRGTLKPATSLWDADAQALFNAVGDVPALAKPIYNDLIVGFKDAGVWDNANFWAIVNVPSRNAFNTLIEIKSLTIVSSFYDTGAISAPYNTARQAYPTKQGYTFKTAGYIRTGFIPSSQQTLNDSCEFIVLYATESNASTINYGAYNSNTQSNQFTTRYGGNAIAHLYGTTTGSSAIVVANTGVPGVYLKNRRSTSYASIVRNGSVLGSITGNGGTLPTVQVYLNGYNNAGTISTRRNGSPVMGWGSFGSGLTAGQETSINTVLSTWQNSLYAIESLSTKNLVFDGNSHLTYWLAATERNVGYDLIATPWRIRNAGVSGQTTAMMSADYAAEIAVMYSGSYTKNILVVIEGTNDLWTNGDVAGAITRMSTYISTAQATGWQVVLVPIMCRSYVGNPAGRTETQFNLDQDDFNEWVMGGATGADAVIQPDSNYFIWRSDYASDAAYNTAVSSLIANATYFYDGTHRTEAGYKSLADQITVAVNSL